MNVVIDQINTEIFDILDMNLCSPYSLQFLTHPKCTALIPEPPWVKLWRIKKCADDSLL